MSNPNPITRSAAAIAAQLGITTSGARATIWRTVRTIDPQRAQAFVVQALEVEANGGMLIPDGSRKRTLGGIFFYLVRTQVSDAEAIAINIMWCSKHKPKKLAQPHEGQIMPTTTAPPTLLPFVCDEAATIMAELMANVGDSSTVKVTVIGRPNQVVSARA